ncbi:hypothetical protein [Arthrobacter sp. Y-9]|uniref:hypothetical protein n=1 Tax=Arthrobacter sp. Y-9 TaxID=3039385 RepID=UPI002420484C|nr:hypothetical protein [Arthrobacter sp. Y-9]WFR84268.1 hypothetical protein P9849_01075 [Arthrobacter sp. Y-9]
MVKKAGKVKLKKALLAVAAGACAVTGSLMVAAPAANATNQVACSGGSFYEIWGHDPQHLCFANQGQMDTYQNKTTSLSTGNNRGQVFYYNFSDGLQYWSTLRPHNYRSYFEPPYVNTWAVRLKP